MLRLPSSAVRDWASKKVAPKLGIKSRTSHQNSDGFPPKSPCGSRNGTVHRKSFVLEHGCIERIDDVYDIMPGKELGAGGFGTVRRASLKGAESVARAVKTVRKCDSKAEELVWREIAILRHIDHPSICRLFETFQDARSVHMVLEFIDGRELFDEIIERRSLDERWAVGIMQQVFGALKYCHEKKIIHRDLKPENIMVTRLSGRNDEQVPRVILIDFGMAVMYTPGCTAAAGGSMGTNDYMAPECLRGHCTPASDVWSAGMVLHAMLIGCLPSSREIATGSSWDHVSSAARELVQGLLQVDLSRRLSAEQAAGHAWTAGVASIPLLPKHVNKMMKNFTSFHGSMKLRRAALTALAMQLTSQQLNDYREQFVAIDSDGNGRISKQELINSISATSPMCSSEVGSWVESVFDSVDTDGSQEIDYTEWVAAAIHESTCRSEQTLLAAFRVFDIDGNGTIDEKEFARVLAQTPQDIASLLPQYDTNGDGVIDFEEFKSLLNYSVAQAANQPRIPRGLTDLSCSSVSSCGTYRGTPSKIGLYSPRCLPPSPAHVMPIKCSL